MDATVKKGQLHIFKGSCSVKQIKTLKNKTYIIAAKQGALLSGK
jgi:hypothetical protein